METTLAKKMMNESEMLQISAGAGKCADGSVQATLLVGCAILGFFNPGVWVAGTAYFYYCNPQA